jgi:hypothetical protein
MRRLCNSDDSEIEPAASSGDKHGAAPDNVRSNHVAKEFPQLVVEGDRERLHLESFIRQRFADDYSAKVSVILPELIALYSADRLPLACLGISPGQHDQKFFLESYLEQPIEQVLSKQVGKDVRREKLVEIGNLVSGNPGSASNLFVILTEFLNQAGFEWGVFTATRTVRHLFSRLGLVLIDLRPANPNCLEDRGQSWGTYYEHEPRVMASSVQQSVLALRQQTHQYLRRNELMLAARCLATEYLIKRDNKGATHAA